MIHKYEIEGKLENLIIVIMKTLWLEKHERLYLNLAGIATFLLTTTLWYRYIGLS